MKLYRLSWIFCHCSASAMFPRITRNPPSHFPPFPTPESGTARVQNDVWPSLDFRASLPLTQRCHSPQQAVKTHITHMVAAAAT